MQAKHLVRNIVATVSIVLVAAVLIGSTTWNSAKVPAAPPVAKTAVPTPMVAVPTGEYENGVPVYRLPSVSVAVSRSAEIARMAREEQLAAK